MLKRMLCVLICTIFLGGCNAAMMRSGVAPSVEGNAVHFPRLKFDFVVTKDMMMVANGATVGSKGGLDKLSTRGKKWVWSGVDGDLWVMYQALDNRHVWSKIGKFHPDAKKVLINDIPAWMVVLERKNEFGVTKDFVTQYRITKNRTRIYVDYLTAERPSSHPFTLLPISPE